MSIHTRYRLRIGHITGLWTAYEGKDWVGCVVGLRKRMAREKQFGKKTHSSIFCISFEPGSASLLLPLSRQGDSS